MGALCSCCPLPEDYWEEYGHPNGHGRQNCFCVRYCFRWCIRAVSHSTSILDTYVSDSLLFASELSDPEEMPLLCSLPPLFPSASDDLTNFYLPLSYSPFVPPLFLTFVHVFVPSAYELSAQTLTFLPFCLAGLAAAYSLALRPNKTPADSDFWVCF
jgi:hypothetical protein